MKRLYAVLLLLALPLSGCQQAKLAYYRYFGPDYIYAGSGPVLASFPPPPAEGSAAEKKDLEILLDWQAKRTDADCAAAGAQAFSDYNEFFGEISPFPDPLPKQAERILFKVYYEGSRAVSLAKKKFARPRPFNHDARVKPCIRKPGSLSYPSGHTAVSRLIALALAEVDPSRRTQFLASADRAALNRVIGGVHYPSDIEAGKKFADRLFAVLSSDEDFRADLERLKSFRCVEEQQAPR